MASSGKGAFRGLLRAVKDLVGSDRNAWQKARAEVRGHFIKSRGVSDPNEVNRLLQDATEAEEFIRFNIVQARKTKPNLYSVKLKDPEANDKKPRTHVDFEPMAPQVALEKSMGGSPKKPELNLSKPQCRNSKNV